MSVSVEEIIWCYRTLLGREPESETVVKAHLKSENFKALVESFVSCQEFLSRRKTTSAKTSERVTLIHQLNLPPNEVDYTATRQQLSECVSVIKSAWSHLGEVKPHFSVLTHERFLPENFENSMDEFWNSGQREASLTQQTLEKHGLKHLNRKTCVEFGCGVGRVTMGLSKIFSRVTAYDISLGNITIAEQRAKELNINNIAFKVCPDTVLLDIQPCDFLYSRIVFQHNPPPIISELISRSLGALLPGGIAIFQVPTYGLGYRFKLDEWLKTGHPLDMQMHCLPQRRVFEICESEGCSLLEVREDNCTGHPDKWISNTFAVRKSPTRKNRFGSK